MQASEVPRALAAAMSTASHLDLTVHDADVLHNSNRLALRLRPCEVLARVAPGDDQAARFEVELAQRLAEPGAPWLLLILVSNRVCTSATASSSPCGPTTKQGRSREISADDYANALERLHAGMRTLDVTTPHFTDRVAEAQQLVASPQPHTGAGRRRPGASRPRLTKPEPFDRRQRRRRAVAAWRAPPGQCAQCEGRAALHRPGDVLPGAGRIRHRPCARGGRRALSGRRSRTARPLPGPRSGHGDSVALGCGRPVPGRTTSRPGTHSEPYAMVHHGRRPTS